MKEWNYENEQWIQLPSHLRHLPLFTRYFDLTSLILRTIWWIFLKFIFFKFYARLKVIGNMDDLVTQYPRLLIVANHASHLDAVSISAAVPYRHWINLYFAAAKDYFFANPFMSFFSKHCIGAIPIDRKDRRGGAVKLCINLLIKLPQIWMVVFPEGTRSTDGKIHRFKKGISVFSERSNTPILFIYLDGPHRLWPKNAAFGRPGNLTVHVGPVQEPAHSEIIYQKYRKWVESIDSTVFADDSR